MVDRGARTPVALDGVADRACAPISNASGQAISSKDSIMKHMVSYKHQADRAAENERYVLAVFEALDQTRPCALRYATFRLDDGLSFIHIVSHDEADGSNALTALPAFKAFAAGVKERCETPPVRLELTEIGSYGFFGK
jgi:hypothetical protein